MIPIFNNKHFLGLTYSENGYVDDKSIEMIGMLLVTRNLIFRQ
jgi:hypothetical protein